MKIVGCALLLTFVLVAFSSVAASVKEINEELESQGVVYDWKDRSRQRGPVQGSGFLSNLRWAGAANSLGPVERNMTNGGRAAGDGQAFPDSFTEGLGVHGNSIFVYTIPKANCYILATEPGNLDTAASPDARILFQIFADGRLIHERDAVQPFALRREIGIRGVKKLTFMTKDPNPAVSNKSANWLNSYLGCD